MIVEHQDNVAAFAGGHVWFNDFFITGPISVNVEIEPPVFGYPPGAASPDTIGRQLEDRPG